MTAFLCLVSSAALIGSASTSAVGLQTATPQQRLAQLERESSEIRRQLDENERRARQLEVELSSLREYLAQGRQPVAAPATASASSTLAAAGTDPGEIAYDHGYRLWRAGKFDQAITALRTTSSSFPTHRRASWARNLAGRALLDKGEARTAAETLLANYRANPKGERAADSLFYLGQSLMRLGRPVHACQAYAELEAVYRPNMREELKTLLPAAKAGAGCRS